MLKLSQNAGPTTAIIPRNATLPSIQGTIWKAEDGTLGIFLANYLEKDNTIEFTIDPAKYGVGAGAGGFLITRIDPEGRGTGILAVFSRAESPCHTETLGPWEIRVLQISPN